MKNLGFRAEIVESDANYGEFLHVHVSRCRVSGGVLCKSSPLGCGCQGIAIFCGAAGQRLQDVVVYQSDSADVQSM